MPQADLSQPKPGEGGGEAGVGDGGGVVERGEMSGGDYQAGWLIGP